MDRHPEAHKGVEEMTERYRCTKKNPWTPGKGGRVEHEDVREVGTQEDGFPGGDIVTYECKNCGHRWKQELPQ